MATYKKTLKTVTFTLHDASTVVAADTADKSVGSNALLQFEAGKLVIIPGEANTTYIPSEMIVKAVVVSAQSDEITKDPYGCDE